MRYQSKRPKRQFLAGVKCSQCSAMDTTVHIQVFLPDFDEHIECIACGHQEKRPLSVDTANTQVVRFVPNPATAPNKETT